jgi:hypothetical protein
MVGGVVFDAYYFEAEVAAAGHAAEELVRLDEAALPAVLLANANN